MSASEHPLQCRCGSVRGTVAHPAAAHRVICYCRDCQASAHALDVAGRTLDPQGGTDLVRIVPRNLQFTQGIEALACLRLTEKGLLRWYAACCRTPIGFTMPNPKISFMGLVHVCLEDGRTPLDRSFGPVTSKVFTGSAPCDPKPKTVGMVKAIGWSIAAVLRARLNGDYRINPLFQPGTATPIAVPRVLSEREWAQARGAGSQRLGR